MDVNKMNRWPFSKGSGIFQLVWLVYLASPIYNIMHQPAPRMWTGFGVLVLFLAATMLGHWDAPRRLVYSMLMTLIIVYFCMEFDMAFWFMGFYIAPLVAMLPSKRQFIIGQGFLLILFVWVIGYHYTKFTGDEMVIFLPSAALMLGLPFLIRTGKRAKELRERLNTANEEISRLIKNEERERISRDLHDTLGHTLSLITLKSELAEKLIDKNPAKAIQEVKDIQATSRAALKQVRELVSGMNAVSIDEELQHAEQLLCAAGIRLHIRKAASRLPAPPLIQNMLGMCLREAVTNVVKHSQAKNCTVELHDSSELITLTVSDDGVGMGGSGSGAPSSGRGLLGMKERLELIEGKLELQSKGCTDGDSTKACGTRLYIAVPKVRKGEG